MSKPSELLHTWRVSDVHSSPMDWGTRDRIAAEALKQALDCIFEARRTLLCIRSTHIRGCDAFQFAVTELMVTGRNGRETISRIVARTDSLACYHWPISHGERIANFEGPSINSLAGEKIVAEAVATYADAQMN